MNTLSAPADRLFRGWHMVAAAHVLPRFWGLALFALLLGMAPRGEPVPGQQTSNDLST